MRTPPTRLNLILIIFQMPHVQYYHLRVYGIKICILEGHKLSVQNISIYNFNRMFLLRVYLLHVLWKEHSTSKINKPYSWTSVSETPVIHVVYLCPGPNLNESLELLQLAFSLFSFFSVKSNYQVYIFMTSYFLISSKIYERIYTFMCVHIYIYIYLNYIKRISLYLNYLLKWKSFCFNSQWSDMNKYF